MDRICEFCSQSIESTNPKAKFCSTKCRIKQYRKLKGIPNPFDSPANVPEALIHIDPFWRRMSDLNHDCKGKPMFRHLSGDIRKVECITCRKVWEVMITSYKS